LGLFGIVFVTIELETVSEVVARAYEMISLKKRPEGTDIR
jgi:hypothetical protein